jgi:DNA-directed RNA polymerase specialized sigma subunit
MADCPSGRRIRHFAPEQETRKMFNFDNALFDIFDRRVTTGKLPLKKEREAIRAAKSGDEAATLKLLYAYACALRKVSGRYRHAGGAWAAGTGDPDLAADRRMAAVEGFLEALYAFDLDGAHSRLAATVEGYVANAVSAAVGAPVAMNVPERTLKRFYSILRKADGDPVKGAALAPQYSMTVDTFISVLAAARSTQPLDGPSDNADGPGDHTNRPDVQVCGRDYYDDVEDKLLVAAAFAAVDDLEEDVCRLAYGFSDYDPIPDSEVGHRLGLSRPKVQRVRASALGKMRNAVGVA